MEQITLRRTLVAIGLVSLLSAGCSSSGAEVQNNGFVTNIAQAAHENENFRTVLYTAPHMQLVLMTLAPGEDIGMETHPNGDQFIRVEEGSGTVVLNGQSQPIGDGTAIVIPAGVEHDVLNTGSSPLRMYVIYSPPEHAPGTVHRTKSEAEAVQSH